MPKEADRIDIIAPAPPVHRVQTQWTLDSKVCMSSLRVRLVWPIWRDFGEVTTTQVQVGGSDLKPRDSSSVFFRRTTEEPGRSDSCPPPTAHGAKLTVHYNTNATPLDGLIGEFGADNIQKSQADLGAENDAIRMFGEINEDDGGRFGPVQVIIVNHAVYVAEDVPLSRMSSEQWNRTLNANLTSSFLVIREYLKGLERLGDDAKDVKDKAAIILVGSTAGKYGEAGHADYSVTKSGKPSNRAD